MSRRTLAETLELLEKQVQCPICLETYRDPKALACLHAYCQGCIQRLLEQQQRDQEVECPQCRSVVAVAGNDPGSLPTVFFINGLIEVYHIMKKAKSNEISCQNCFEAMATSFCYICSMFICASCTNAHMKMKVFESHEVIPIFDMRGGVSIQLATKKTPTSSCPEHDGELLKLYCFECQQLICRDCTLVDHTGHRYDFVTGVADGFKQELLSSLVPLRDTHARVTMAIAKLKDNTKEITAQGANIVAIISQSFDQLYATLNKHKQVLLQQAQEVVGKKVTTLDKQQEDLTLVLATLDSLVGFVEGMAENASDEEFISSKQQMISRVQEINEKYKCLELAPAEVADIGMVMPQADSFLELCQKQSQLYISVADASKCYVSGPGVKSATIKNMSKCTVHTHDTHSQPTPVQQHVSAELKSLVDGSVLQVTVVSQTPSTSELSYTPTIRGRHELTVRVNNAVIAIFEVFVQYPPTLLSTPVRVIEGVTPLYIAFGNKGELFVTECWNHRYTVFDCQGQRVLNVGSNGKPPFDDEGPTGIATDSEGNVYVASDHKVQKFNRCGEVVKSIGKKGENVGEFDSPWGVRCHNHQVYVCDRNNSRVQVFDSDLNFVQLIGNHGNGPGQLKKPEDIDFDNQGNVYVLDFIMNQVLIFSENGHYLHHFGQRGEGKGELSDPYGLCVSGDYVYVTEWRNNRVSVFHTSGEFVHSFGNDESDRDELKYPWGIAVDRDGFVFVCDGSSCIQVF